MKGRTKHIALALGATIFFGVLYSLGPSAIWRSIEKARYGYLALTLLFFLASSYLRMYKWVLMRDRMGASITFPEISAVYFSSKFWGLVSPMRSGEVLPAIAGGGGESRLGKLLSIILYDRVIETFQTLIVFGALFFDFYGVFFGAGTGFGLAGILVVLALVAFVMVSKGAGERVFGFADSALALFGGTRPARALRGFLQGMKSEMEEFYGATRSYFTVWFTLANLMLTFACWGLDILLWVMLFKAMNIATSLLVTVAAVVVYSMVGALAPIPGGLGVSDMSFALVLARFGYTGEAGGVIIVSRILIMAYHYLAYMLTNMPPGVRKALGRGTGGGRG